MRSFGKMKPRSYVKKDRMLRASVRCQFKCIRCEGVRGRSAAGPPSLSSTLLRYYTASIVHILHIYTYYILYIYISTYTWTYHCLYEAEGTEAKRTEKYIYIRIPSHSINLYIYIFMHIYMKRTRIPGITRFLRFLVPSFSCSHVWFSLLS